MSDFEKPAVSISEKPLTPLVGSQPPNTFSTIRATSRPMRSVWA